MADDEPKEVKWNHYFARCPACCRHDAGPLPDCTVCEGEGNVWVEVHGPASLYARKTGGAISEERIRDFIRP